MTARHCLILVQSSPEKPPSAFTVRIPPDREARDLLETIRTRLQEIDMEKGKGFKQFFKTYICLQRREVLVATLRPVKANNLETLPPCDALVKTSLLNDALTKALLNPDSMDSTFCNHFFELYNDVFVDVARQDGRVQLPRKAL
ncbi:hypothetical protein EsH8_IV_000792 [Colletotrichum jinshuiense]